MSILLIMPTTPDPFNIPAAPARFEYSRQVMTAGE
jgi:hypothetical protein